MTESAPFAITPSGHLVCGDGPELLVYDGQGRPTWKVFGEGLLLAVGGDGEIVTGDADGRVCWYGALDGRLIAQQAVGPTRAWALSTGRAAALGPHGAVLVEREGASRQIPGSFTAGAFDTEGGTLGLGAADGSFRVVDAGGEIRGSVMLGASVTGVTWSPSGVWLVTAGSSAFTVSDDASAVLGRYDGRAELSHPAVSADGLFAAVLHGQHGVVLLELGALSPLGHVSFRRPVGGLAFGRSGWLGIGHDDGDATLIELAGSGSARTEPHPGRGRNVWNVDSQLDQAAIRGVLARGRAGGVPLAAYTGAGAKTSRSRLPVLMGCLGCAGLSFGCVGLGVLLWLLQSVS